MNDNRDDNLTDMLSNTLFKMRETFKPAQPEPVIHLPYQPTTPLYTHAHFDDCTHVGYDFPEAGEPQSMMDLWVYVTENEERRQHLVLIRQGPKAEDYFTQITMPSGTWPSMGSKWKRVYDAWKFHKEMTGN